MQIMEIRLSYKMNINNGYLLRKYKRSAYIDMCDEVIFIFISHVKSGKDTMQQVFSQNMLLLVTEISMLVPTKNTCGKSNTFQHYFVH